MPWTTSDVDQHKAGLSDSQKKRWVAVANKCLSDGGDDGKCIRIANGVADKQKDLDCEFESAMGYGEKYQYVDSWDYTEHAVSQESAGYAPLGSTDTKGCANCQFFIPPGRCSVVAGDISPTGLSNLWRAKEVFTATPIPVTIVKDADGTERSAAKIGLKEKLINAVSQIFSGPDVDVEHATVPLARAKAVGETQDFHLFRQKDGRLRFFTMWSNNFMDREGEVFPEYAHKEYVEYSNEAQAFPELWMWHTPGTKYGQVDWMDMTDGFVCASGLIDSDKEMLAEQLAKEDVGVSHGFYGILSGKEYPWYRTYEISTLPRANAAVWTTSFNLLNEGVKEMAFTQQRKDFLIGHGVSAEQIADFEKNAAALSKGLRDLGVSYKDTSLEPEPETPAASAAPATPTAPVVDAKDADFQTTVLTSIGSLTSAVNGLVGVVNGIETRVKSVEQTDDQKIAAAMAARVTPGTKGTPASESGENIVSTVQQSKDQAFFGETFLAPFGAPAATQA